MSIQTKKDRNKFSGLRQSLHKLTEEVLALVDPFMKDMPVIAGSVYEIKRKCGKPNCRCASGELHARMVVSSKVAGKTKLTVIPKGSLVEVQRNAGRYRELRQCRARLIIVVREMLKVMSEMENMRRGEVK